MKNATRRREIMARQKEGVHREFGSGRYNRERNDGRSNRTYYGESEEPGYRNREKSARNEQAWERREHNRPGGDGRADGTDRSSRKNRDRTSEREYNYDDRRHDEQRDEIGLSQRNYNYNDRMHDEQRDEIGLSQRNYNYETENGSYLYGEHPASGGEEEYQGTNKRRSGFVGNRYHNRYDERYTGPEQDFFPEENVRRYHSGRIKEFNPPNHKNDTRLAIRDYTNRGQYEKPFHPMQIYDPIQSEHKREKMSIHPGIDHQYRYEGYQQSGNAEGFGRRGGRQQGHDWLDEDEYREGHAPRQRGYGKYGSH